MSPFPTTKDPAANPLKLHSAPACSRMTTNAYAASTSASPSAFLKLPFSEDVDLAHRPSGGTDNRHGCNTILMNLRHGERVASQRNRLHGRHLGTDLCRVGHGTLNEPFLTFSIASSRATVAFLGCRVARP